MNFKIIDIHTHAWPEKIAKKAQDNLEDIFKVSFVDGPPTVSTLLKYMDKNNIDISVICAVAPKPEKVESINDWLFSVRSNRLKAFCAFHPDYKDWQNELKRIKENGDGIKMQPEFQDFYVDEDKLYPIYDEIVRLDIPVLFHCGHELSGTMLVRSSPDRIKRVKDDFPSLKIIAAHFGGFKLWDDVERHLLGRDIYLDTSYFFRYLDVETVKRMLKTHREDRLLFGTDFPLVDQADDIEYLRRLDIELELKERIFFKNAQELLGI
jgi:uncharacterized protein